LASSKEKTILLYKYYTRQHSSYFACQTKVPYTPVNHMVLIGMMMTWLQRNKQYTTYSIVLCDDRENM